MGSGANQRTFDFSRYADAVAKQLSLIGRIEEVQRALDQANTEVAEQEMAMQEALAMSLAEVRDYVSKLERLRG